MTLYKPFDRSDERIREVALIHGLTGPQRETLHRVLQTIDPDRCATMLERRRASLADFNPTNELKYCDLPFWIAHKAALATALGLDRQPPLDILDIGMGAGHLGAVAQALGHRYLGTDITSALYDEIADVLAVERRTVPVRRGKPYPDLGRRFDLITIIWQTFDIGREGGERTYWPLSAWLGLLGDLTDRHLKPGGAIYLQLNSQIHPDGNRLPPELMAWAAARGGVTGRMPGELRFDGLQPGSGFFDVDGAGPDNPRPETELDLHDREILAAMRERLQRLGQDESGFFRYYSGRVQAWQGLSGAERALYSHLRTRARVVHAGVGIGTLAVALARVGVPCLGFEQDERRYAAALDLKATVAPDAPYELRHGSFPAALRRGDRVRDATLLFTDFNYGWSDAQTEAAIVATRRFPRTILDLRQFGCLRDEPAERAALARRLEAGGLRLEELDLGVEGAFYVECRPVAGPVGALRRWARSAGLAGLKRGRIDGASGFG